MSGFNDKAAQSDFLVKAIQEAVRMEVDRITQEEAEKAAKEVERRCIAIADSIALRVLSHYEIISDGHRVTIEVKKLAPTSQDGGA